ncbi:MAG: bifunctional 3-(3-hydroxy-phenyl)propionate/3-hydroxycinnamic acid hydroxylase [Pigmentiphaga sp.]|nr:bifunctional 3-(3-hydroxy-phenyl)propionate/3-hydroxycinnamic acid hydroxylase [Pigmentiphaga sp.]
MTPSSHFDADVIVIGAGPTGLVLAHLLAQAGIATLLLEKLPHTVDEARAVSIDDESLRTLQATGMLPAILPHITQGYGVHYYSWRNRLFAAIDPPSREHGYLKRNAFRQQKLVRQLADGLAGKPKARIRFNHEVAGFEQDAEGVTLRVLQGGRTLALRCRWLVACDGGRSGTREQLAIPLEGSTYGERWLIADLLERSSPFRHTRTFCDPRRPAIRLPGPDGSLRYEFMLHPGENAEAALEDATLRAWIRERDPADAGLPLARKVVYTFHARIARRWRDGRVFLAGDAAHLTPPFAGQGMNSGIRDAANLAWKLAAVAHGRLPPSLLDSYEQERKPHAWALIRMAQRIGWYMQPKSRASAILTQGLLRLACLLPPARDYILHLKFKPKPRFATGYFKGGAPAAVIPPGQLWPQPLVELPGGERTLLDNALGDGFAWLYREGTTPPPEHPGMPTRRIAVVARADDFLPGHGTHGTADARVRDSEDVLGQLLEAAGADAVLVRPDRYVYEYRQRSTRP